MHRPGDLYTIDSLHDETEISKDTLYDLARDDTVLGRPLGFKIGRRWFIHPDDWDEFVDRRRGVGVEGLPTASSTPASRAS